MAEGGFHQHAAAGPQSLHRTKAVFSVPWWLSNKESTCQCRRYRFNPWIGKISWGRKWQPTPVFLPGRSHGQRSLAGYSPWGHKESDKSHPLSMHAYLTCSFLSPGSLEQAGPRDSSSPGREEQRWHAGSTWGCGHWSQLPVGWREDYLGPDGSGISGHTCYCCLGTMSSAWPLSAWLLNSPMRALGEKVVL